jgi:site-specific DNA-methyltransferase (adenine-specific)
MIKLLKGNCLEQMKSLPDNSVDSIVTDPPYGISFMAKKWDYDVPSVEVWQEAMRVLKPGGHALIACGTRTQHRMVVNIEDAGFEIRDVVSWIYGSGFPKSLNISKAIDKAAGAEREVVGIDKSIARKDGRRGDSMGRQQGQNGEITAPATEAAKQWDGWGTALKPSCEFFTLCRKPLSESTIAKNVLKWGTGGINIDGCRVASDGSHMVKGVVTKRTTVAGDDRKDAALGMYGAGASFAPTNHEGGRFPANLIHDGSQEVLDLFPETKSRSNKGASSVANSREVYGKYTGKIDCGASANHDPVGAKGSAARFFYCPKASKKDRDEGLPTKSESLESSEIVGNNHPTIKPTALMQYLCRLITPTGGVVLDPYMGSGSTGKAAIKEGFGFVGCELDEDYFLIASQRVKNELD